jgi:hypothetical protein
LGVVCLRPLSTKDAGAIVRYREANGGFKTLDDVKRVPDLDLARDRSQEGSVRILPSIVFTPVPGPSAGPRLPRLA